MCKLICNEISREKHGYIDKYRTTITAKYKYFPDNIVKVESAKLEFKPWKSWRKTKNPTWWKNYNKVKHQRNDSYEEASLENTIESLCALFILEFYYYEGKFKHPPSIRTSFIGLSYIEEPWLTAPKMRMKDFDQPS